MIRKGEIAAIAGERRVYDDAFIEIVTETDAQVETRLEALVSLVRGKSVLHVGCCDHVEIIDEKRRNGLWLHDLLRAASSFCAGVDINAEGVDYVRKLGVPDVYCADIVQGLPAQLAQRRFDVVVVGEVVEHVDAPVGFLRGIRNAVSGPHVVVVSVPNAFFLENFENAICGVERINTDHRFWFTPYTISKILSQAGYGVRDVRFVFRGEPGGYCSGSGARKRIVESGPALRDVLLAIASSDGGAVANPGEFDLGAPERVRQYETHDIGMLAADESIVRALLKRVEDVEKDREQAYVKLSEAWKAHDAVAADRDAAYAQLAEAWKAHDAVAADRDAAYQKLAEARKVHDAVAADRDAAYAQLAEAWKAHDAVAVDRDAAYQKLAEAWKAHDAVATDRDAAYAKLTEAWKLYDTLTADRDAVCQKLKSTSIELQETVDALSKIKRVCMDA